MGSSNRLRRSDRPIDAAALEEIRPLAERVAAGETTDEDEAVLYASFLRAVGAKEEPDRIIDTGDASELMDRLRAVARLLEDGKHVEAIEAAAALREEQPTVAPSCENIAGAAWFHLKDYRRAIRHYALAAIIDPSHLATARDNIAEAREAAKVPADLPIAALVRAVLTAALMDPEVEEAESGDAAKLPGMLLIRGEVLRRLGAPQLAVPDLTRAREIAPRNDAVTFALVSALAATGNGKAKELQARFAAKGCHRDLEARVASFVARLEAEGRERWEGHLARFEG